MSYFFYECSRNFPCDYFCFNMFLLATDFECKCSCRFNAVIDDTTKCAALDEVTTKKSIIPNNVQSIFA